MSKEVSRRSFVKAGAGATALAGVAATGAFSFGDWFEKANAAEEAEERIAYTYHQEHCSGACAMKCTVRDERLSLIEPNDAFVSPIVRPCCLKGLSDVQRVYSPERLQTPLKRVGERGAGEFVSITWEEALQTIGDEIKKLWTNYGKQSVYFSASAELMGLGYTYLPALLGCQTASWPGIDMGCANGLDPAIGLVLSGTGQNEITDWVNAKTLIFIGENFLESGLVRTKAFFDAKEAGCKIITVDPLYNTTAAKSDQWIPIKGGTDPALALGMVTAIIDNQWYDADFMKSYTAFPFLISRKTGKKLFGAPDTAILDADGKPIPPELIWDTKSNSAKPHNAVDIEPALEGEYTIEGEKYATVFTILIENQKAYTLEWASEVTELSEGTIKNLAKQYANVTPSTICLGWGGADKYANADIMGHAVALLVGLTGNSAKPGASTGGNHYGTHWFVPLASWPIPESFVTAPVTVPHWAARTQPSEIRAFIDVGDTFQLHAANLNLTEAWLKTLDLVVAIDVMNSESVRFADIVLPVCTRFESDEEVGFLRVANNNLQIQGRVIAPLFDSKSDFRIEKLIATAVGLGEYLPDSSEQYSRFMLENSPDPRLKGITLEQVMNNQNVLLVPGTETPSMLLKEPVYFTPSTKYDIYYENMLPFDQQLPKFEYANEVYPDNPKRSTYPLHLITHHTRFRIHSQYGENTWIQQFYEPYLEMNVVDTEARGLTDGEIIEVRNDRGFFRVPVRINASIRPGAARIYECTWTRFMEDGNIQNVTNDYINERGYVQNQGPVIPFHDTLVEVSKVVASGGGAK